MTLMSSSDDADCGYNSGVTEARIASRNMTLLTPAAHHCNLTCSSTPTLSSTGNGIGSNDQSTANGDENNRRGSRTFLADYADRRRRRLDDLNAWLRRSSSTLAVTSDDEISQSSLLCPLPPPCLEPHHPDDIFFEACQDLSTLIDFAEISQD